MEFNEKMKKFVKKQLDEIVEFDGRYLAIEKDGKIVFAMAVGDLAAEVDKFTEGI